MKPLIMPNRNPTHTPTPTTDGIYNQMGWQERGHSIPSTYNVRRNILTGCILPLLVLAVSLCLLAWGLGLI